MHRHPLRDNMLHTIAMQIMALHVHTKAEQRPCRAASLSACRPTRTYTHAQTHMHKHTCTQSVLFGSALYLVFLRVPALVPRPQQHPPLHPDSSAPFVCLSGIQLLAEGAWARDKTHFTASDGGPNTILRAHTYTFTFVHIRNIGWLPTKFSCSQSNTRLFMGPCILRQIIRQHTLQGRAQGKKTLVLYMLVSDFKI